MSEKLASQTIVGIYQYCETFIKEEEARNQILLHLTELLDRWEESWNTIKTWLKDVELNSLEKTLSDFVNRIPQLRSFSSLIHHLLEFHPSFWNTVYENLGECQRLLQTKS